jgi:hypothetical protein
VGVLYLLLFVKVLVNKRKMSEKCKVDPNNIVHECFQVALENNCG